MLPAQSQTQHPGFTDHDPAQCKTMDAPGNTGHPGSRIAGGRACRIIAATVFLAEAARMKKGF
jgi:hypothetical protein